MTPTEHCRTCAPEGGSPESDRPPGHLGHAREVTPGSRCCLSNRCKDVCGPDRICSQRKNSASLLFGGHVPASESLRDTHLQGKPEGHHQRDVPRTASTPGHRLNPSTRAESGEHVRRPRRREKQQTRPCVGPDSSRQRGRTWGWVWAEPGRDRLWLCRLQGKRSELAEADAEVFTAETRRRPASGHVTGWGVPTPHGWHVPPRRPAAQPAKPLPSCRVQVPANGRQSRAETAHPASPFPVASAGQERGRGRLGTLSAGGRAQGPRACTGQRHPGGVQTASARDEAARPRTRGTRGSSEHAAGSVWPDRTGGYGPDSAAGGRPVRVPRRRDRGRPSGKAAPSRRLQRTSRSRQQCLRAGDGHAPRAAAPPGCAAPALACKPQPGVHPGPIPGPGACDLPTPTLAGPSREQPWAAGRADCSCTTPSALPPWEAAAAPTMAPQHCDLNRGTVRVLREHGLRPRDRSRVGTSRRAGRDAGEDARFPAATGRLAACLGCLRARRPGWSLLHPLRPSNMEPH